jgi:RimJ/RimL family protein N-acetyltransferase
MLIGKRITLRIAESEDAPLLAQWFNSADFVWGYQHFPVQITSAQLEKQINEKKNYQNEWVDFVIEKKNKAKIGWAAHYVSAPNFGWIEIGYAIIPSERNNGYATEAIQILRDYLFLTKEITRVQAIIDAENVASRKALESSGFKKEGRLRKALWNAKGNWADGDLYAIVREDWKKPRILKNAG